MLALQILAGLARERDRPPGHAVRGLAGVPMRHVELANRRHRHFCTHRFHPSGRYESVTDSWP